MTTTQTYWARIWVGFRECYDGPLHLLEEARAVCREYADRVGYCFSLTPCEFVYKGGGEPGCVVGLLNYPRFPADPGTIRRHALAVAEWLRRELGQYRVTVEFPDETVMLEGTKEDTP